MPKADHPSNFDPISTMSEAEKQTIARVLAAITALEAGDTASLFELVCELTNPNAVSYIIGLLTAVLRANADFGGTSLEENVQNLALDIAANA